MRVDIKCGGMVLTMRSAADDDARVGREEAGVGRDREEASGQASKEAGIGRGFTGAFVTLGRNEYAEYLCWLPGGKHSRYFDADQALSDFMEWLEAAQEGSDD